MKVITEEGLRYVLKMHFGSDDVNQSICSHLINELQELDTLTVSKLRPMSEVPRNGEWFLGYYKGVASEYFEILFFSVSGKLRSHRDEFNEEDVLGWIPIPIYKPEEQSYIVPNPCG